MCCIRKRKGTGGFFRNGKMNDYSRRFDKKNKKRRGEREG
jgi:hypothetical protein